MLAYVQNWSPFALEFGSGGVRWYGLAYLAGFVVAIWLLKWFSKRDLIRLSGQQCTDYIVLCALIGVMIGGRLGYVLLYDPSLLGFSDSFPWWRALKIWEGGMASHGGIVGVTLFTYWYGWKHKIPAVHLGDNIVVATPLGLAFGRFANFVNGELYGRPVEHLSWAMKFPQAVLTEAATDPAANARLQAIRSEATAAGHPFVPPQGYSSDFVDPRLHVDQLLHAERAGDPALSDIFEHYLLPRHPSQLYEMIVEGLLLFAILLAVRIIGGKRLPYGVITGLFFLLYAAGRIFVEQFRVPDAELIAGFTRGQFYSLFMVIAAIGFFIYAATRGKRLAREYADRSAN